VIAAAQAKGAAAMLTAQCEINEIKAWSVQRESNPHLQFGKLWAKSGFSLT
jgi:hypothetical protein